MQWVKNAISSLSSMIIPPSCVVCRHGLFSSDSSICKECVEQLVVFCEPRCRKCGRGIPLGAASICLDCAKKRSKTAFILPVGPYQFPLREMILALKSKGSGALAGELAELMAMAIHKDGRTNSEWTVVPVPLSPLRFRMRGFNQAELLAVRLALLTGCRLKTGTLKKTLETPQQNNLSRLYRLKNLSGAFFAQESSFKGDNVLLVDDVVTTGSTVNECANALKKAGAKRVAVSCVSLTLPEDSLRR